MSTSIHDVAGNDRLIRLHDVPTLNWLPDRRGGARLNVSTVWRWCLRGTAGVKLAHVSAGGTHCTTEAWLKEFFEAIAQARQGGRPAPLIRTPRQRERSIRAAGAELDAAGIK
jgi:uncharacterized protein DUF1580